ncbi:methionine-rich copper-binding protein CopC [Thermocatellispora tengchongensis]|uniref:Methionine-rich copper-binding protein CopC n=1 Tax=Thermocatellispora tengchongensis TaxID=1073253 RepID=A0A840PA28_9ACTN|nr:hypothetical protein [Thermocatellispora tengchongensis]MBB5132855.1 methionine-rich copper-binding protein CopC [Thermocatellispora tengchongensis]
MKSKRSIAIALGIAAAAACATTATVAHAEQDAAAPAQRAATALPPGYQLVTLPNANVPNFQRRVVYCPGSKRVLGGGAEARGNRAILVGSFPTDDGRGWIGLGRQDGYNDVGISVFAICAD